MRKTRLYAGCLSACIMLALGTVPAMGAFIFSPEKAKIGEDVLSTNINEAVHVGFGASVNISIYGKGNNKSKNVVAFVFTEQQQNVTDWKRRDYAHIMTNNLKTHSCLFPLLPKGDYLIHFGKYVQDWDSATYSAPFEDSNAAQCPTDQSSHFCVVVTNSFSNPAVDGSANRVGNTFTKPSPYGSDAMVRVECAENLPEVYYNLVYKIGTDGTESTINFSGKASGGSAEIALPVGTNYDTRVYFRFHSGYTNTPDEVVSSLPENTDDWFSFFVGAPLTDATCDGTQAKFEACYTNNYFSNTTVTVHNVLPEVFSNVWLHYSSMFTEETNVLMAVAGSAGTSTDFTYDIPAMTGPGPVEYYFTASNSVDGHITRLPEITVGEINNYRYYVESPFSEAKIADIECTMTDTPEFAFTNPPSVSIRFNGESDAGKIRVWYTNVADYIVGGCGFVDLCETSDNSGVYTNMLPVLATGEVQYRFQLVDNGTENVLASFPIDSGEHFTYKVQSPFSNQKIAGLDAANPNIQVAVDGPPSFAVDSNAGSEYSVRVSYESPTFFKILPDGSIGNSIDTGIVQLAASDNKTYESSSMIPLPMGNVKCRFELMTGNVIVDASSNYSYKVTNALSDPICDNKTATANSSQEVKFGKKPTISVKSLIQSDKYSIYAVCYTNGETVIRSLNNGDSGTEFTNSFPAASVGVVNFGFYVTGKNSGADIVYSYLPENILVPYSYSIPNPLSEPKISQPQNATEFDLSNVASTNVYSFTNSPMLRIMYAGETNLPVSVSYRFGGGEEQRTILMSQVSGSSTDYQVKMPPMPAGEIEYTFSVRETAETPPVHYEENSSNVWFAYVVTNDFGVDRQPDVEAWRKWYERQTPIAGSEYVKGGNSKAKTNGWFFANILVDPFENFYLKPSGYVVHGENAGPIGSIWLKARYTKDVGAGELEVALFQENTRPTQFGKDVYLYSERVPVYNTGNDWQLIRVDWNIASNLIVRIKNTSEIQDSAIQIREVLISPPSADVVIEKNPLDYHPGYPSNYDPVRFSVNVESKFESPEAVGISPKLVWRLNSGAWKTNSMSNGGGTGTKYEVELPAADLVPGRFEYFYRVDFDGYYYIYGVTETEQSKVVNKADFGKWYNYSSDTISEARDPGYCPDFKDSHLYDLCNNDEVEKLSDDYGFGYLGFTVRRFRSNFDTMTLNISPTNGTTLHTKPEYDMQLVGDYKWQAIINTTNAIDVAMNLVGTYQYTGEDSINFNDTNIVWRENDQEIINPPLFGHAEIGGTNEICAQIDYQGFLMFRFDACSTNQPGLNYEYQIRRAAWQDFNMWQASDSEFARSFGLFETTIYRTDLDGEENETGSGVSPIGDFESITDPKNGDFSMSGLEVRRGALIDEPKLPGQAYGNKALRLDANPYAPGSVETTSTTGTDGSDTLKMRVRMGFDDEYLAYYRRGILFENYVASAKVVTTERSPASPWVSIIGYYTDPENYIEGRVTQKADEDGNKYLVGGVIKHINGITNVVEEKRLYIPYSISASLSTPLRLELSLASTNDASNTVTVKFNTYHEYLNNEQQLCTYTNKISSVDILIDPDTIMGGTIGVNSGDCIANFEPAVSELPGNTSTFDFADVSASPQQKAWYLGGNMSGVPGSRKRWAFTRPSSQSGCKLNREKISVPYRVLVFRTGEEEYASYMAPVGSSGGWVTNWNETLQLKSSDGSSPDEEKSTESLTYGVKQIDFPMHLWDNVYIKIMPLGSDGYLVVDNLYVTKWRGITEDHDPNNVSLIGPDADNVWTATYDRRVIRNHSMMYEFAVSRANPNKRQYLQSPVMDDGVGDIVFNYEVTDEHPNHPGANKGISFSVVCNDNSGDFSNFGKTLIAVTNALPDGMKRLYAAHLTNMVGRLRIIVDHGNSSPTASLWIDNVRATDYPVVGDESWAAYNALISSLPNDADKKFDGAYNIDLKSAVLNDSPNKNTLGGAPYDDHLPYIQTPLINTGLGEISFWYRAYNPDPRNPAKIVLKVAPSAATRDEDWKDIDREKLKRDGNDPRVYVNQVNTLRSLESITNEQWRYFSIETYDTENGVLRIYSVTNGPSRPMLDNVLVTEPVRSSVEIAEVGFTPDIPLDSGPVGIRVRLKNPRMNPNVTNVAFSYVTSTNNWGVGNWKDSAEKRVINLTPADPDNELLFTSGDNNVPRLPRDTVVQYEVVIEYSGVFPVPVRYSDQFTNPEWYEPVDLNESLGGGTNSSPYYYVFTLTTNVVMINEFYPSYSVKEQKDEYVELMGPINGNIEDWTLEHFKAQDIPGGMVPPSAFCTNTMKQGARFVKDTNVVDIVEVVTNESTHVVTTNITYNCWGFYILGRSGAEDILPEGRVLDQELFPGKADDDNDFYLDGGSANTGGAMCLKRSMGAYVDRISWGPKGYKFEPFGFINMNVTRPTSKAGRKRAFAVVEDESGGELGWNTFPAHTPGTYNYGEFENLSPVSPVEESDAPSSEFTVSISGITTAAAGDGMEISFTVTSTNGVALEAGSGWNWYVCRSSNLGFTNPEDVLITGVDVTAGADGTPSEYTVKVDYANPPSETEFYRIKAVPSAQ